MDGICKLVILGWGVEFGKYYCGGAPARKTPKWINGLLHIEELPAVPVSWSYGFGIHWRSPAKDDEMDRGHWWRCRYFYGKNHECNSGPARAAYLDGVMEKMSKDWK
jgi:hypothetical protein